MEFLSIKWLWLYAGVFLMLMELITPGFVIFFFGLAAMAVGGLLFFVELSGTAQAAMFSVLAILGLLTLRRSMMSAFMGNTPVAGAIENEYVGRVGKVVEEIRPGMPGRVMLGDAEWSADAAIHVENGEEVRVVAQKNLTLVVEKI